MAAYLVAYLVAYSTAYSGDTQWLTRWGLLVAYPFSCSRLAGVVNCSKRNFFVSVILLLNIKKIKRSVLGQDRTSLVIFNTCVLIISCKNERQCNPTICSPQLCTIKETSIPHPVQFNSPFSPLLSVPHSSDLGRSHLRIVSFIFFKFLNSFKSQETRIGIFKLDKGNSDIPSSATERSHTSTPPK